VVCSGPLKTNKWSKSKILGDIQMEPERLWRKVFVMRWYTQDEVTIEYFARDSRDHTIHKGSAHFATYQPPWFSCIITYSRQQQIKTLDSLKHAEWDVKPYSNQLHAELISWCKDLYSKKYTVWIYSEMAHDYDQWKYLEKILDRVCETKQSKLSQLHRTHLPRLHYHSQWTWT